MPGLLGCLMFPADLIRPSRYWLPLTYAPKIPGVLAGTIRQTIRVAGKTRYQAGDLIAFHGWAGKPYRSPWSFRTEYFELREAIPILIMPYGISSVAWKKHDELARLDGISPATGLELGRVLCEYNDIPESGAPGYILRW